MCMAGMLRILSFLFPVESRCGAVALGIAYLLPSLSSDGASIAKP